MRHDEPGLVREPRTDAPLCDEDEILKAVAQEQSPPGAELAGAFYRLPPIYFIGDSRVMQFRNAVYVSEYTGRPYHLRSLHLRGLHAADFFSPETGLNPALLGALAVDQAVTSRDEGMQWTATAWNDVTAAPAAPLVLFCGPYDVHRVMDELGPDADIPAWDDISRRYDVSTREPSRLVSADDVFRRVLEVMQPFARGIDALRAIGFSSIFVHGCYRARRSERFERMYGAFKVFRQYHPNALPKVVALFDDAVRSIAAQTSSRYVCGPVDEHGVLVEEATWDDVHYNDRGVAEVARSVVSVLEGVVE
jgi:hypothetical protein